MMNMLPNRNKKVSHICNFLVDTLKKKQLKSILIIYFIQPNVSKTLPFQHVTLATLEVLSSSNILDK